ncbi:MAG: beta-eliminating lyase-related protein [Actinomycetota bacterium]
MIELRSDNTARAAPEVLQAVVDVNTDTAAAYGDDEVTARLQQRVREVFEHDTARIFPVTSGTAGNAIGLSSIVPPWGAVVCHPTAHIQSNEPGSMALFAGGAQLSFVDGDRKLIEPDLLDRHLTTFAWNDPHNAQLRAISVTQPTDFGTVYPLDRLRELTRIGREHGLRAHLDGARFANALDHLGCTPADMTWRSGIDVFTLGMTKNGGMSAELIVSFDDDASDELFFRTKRGGHVTSKMWFLSAQVEAHLADDLWLRLAGQANRAMARLAGGLREHGVRFVEDPDVNMLFLHLPEPAIARLEEHVAFYRIAAGLIRFVTSWQTTDADVDAVLDQVGATLAAA